MVRFDFEDFQAGNLLGDLWFFQHHVETGGRLRDPKGLGTRTTSSGSKGQRRGGAGDSNRQEYHGSGKEFHGGKV